MPQNVLCYLCIYDIVAVWREVFTSVSTMSVIHIYQLFVEAHFP